MSRDLSPNHYQKNKDFTKKLVKVINIFMK